MQGDTRRGRATNPAGAAGSFFCHRKAILVRGTTPTADRDRPCSMPNDRLPFIDRTVPLPRHFAAGLSGFVTGQDGIASTICLIASSLARKRLRRASCVRIETAPARGELRIIVEGISIHWLRLAKSLRQNFLASTTFHNAEARGGFPWTYPSRNHLPSPLPAPLRSPQSRMSSAI